MVLLGGFLERPGNPSPTWKPLDDQLDVLFQKEVGSQRIELLRYARIKNLHFEMYATHSGYTYVPLC